MANETVATVKQALLDKQKDLIASSTSLKEVAYITKAIADSQKILTDTGLSVLDTNTPYGVLYDRVTDSYFSLGHGIPVVQQTMRRVVCTGNPRYGGTIHKYLNPQDSTKYLDGTSALNDINGSTGKQVFTEIQKHYKKVYMIGSQEFKLISLLPFDGATTEPLFRKDGWTAGADGTDVLNEVPFDYLTAFESSLYDASAGVIINGTGDSDTTSLIDTATDKLMSVVGFRPWSGITRAEARTLMANGGGKQFNILQLNCLKDLFEIEFLTKNSQSVLAGYTEKLSGATYTGSVVRAGLTVTLGNSTGTITGKPSDNGGGDTGTLVIANSYRGVENLFGHLWQWVDGININNGIPYIIANTGVTFVDDSIATGYAQATDLNGNLITLPTASGYISELHLGVNYPKVLNGNTVNNVGDYYWYNTGWRVLRSGASLNSGSQAGLSAWNGYDGSAYSSWSICGR